MPERLWCPKFGLCRDMWFQTFWWQMSGLPLFAKRTLAGRHGVFQRVPNQLVPSLSTKNGNIMFNQFWLFKCKSCMVACPKICMMPALSRLKKYFELGIWIMSKKKRNFTKINSNDMQFCSSSLKLNCSWKTFLCCYGESEKRVTQVNTYLYKNPNNKRTYQKTPLQYKTVIHNYIKIVNFKFIFIILFLLFQFAEFYGCLIHSPFNAAPYEMFYLTWIIAQPPEIYYLQRQQKHHGSSMVSRGTKPTKSKTGEISQPVIG